MYLRSRYGNKPTIGFLLLVIFLELDWEIFPLQFILLLLLFQFVLPFIQVRSLNSLKDKGSYQLLTIHPSAKITITTKQRQIKSSSPNLIRKFSLRLFIKHVGCILIGQLNHTFHSNKCRNYPNKTTLQISTITTVRILLKKEKKEHVYIEKERFVPFCRQFCKIFCPYREEKKSIFF